MPENDLLNTTLVLIVQKLNINITVAQNTQADLNTN